MTAAALSTEQLAHAREINQDVSPEGRHRLRMVDASIRRLDDYPAFLRDEKDLHFHFVHEHESALTPAFPTREQAAEALADLQQEHPHAAIASNAWPVGCGHRAVWDEIFPVDE